jgi:hypothetical protein
VARRGIFKPRERLANIEIATVASEDEGRIKCWEVVWLAYEMGRPTAPPSSAAAGFGEE